VISVMFVPWVTAAINTDTHSALCAYATACQREVVCVAHVTNSMAAAVAVRKVYSIVRSSCLTIGS
jgi:hypothetical protein